MIDLFDDAVSFSWIDEAIEDFRGNPDEHTATA